MTRMTPEIVRHLSRAAWTLAREIAALNGWRTRDCFGPALRAIHQETQMTERTPTTVIVLPQFPFSRAFNDAARFDAPTREWDAGTKIWSMTVADAQALLEILAERLRKNQAEIAYYSPAKSKRARDRISLWNRDNRDIEPAIEALRQALA